MFEESISSIPSLWASVISWLTPTVLFVLLNLMIGTIAITSSLGTQNQHRGQQQQEETHELRGQQPQRLARSPSVLQRLKSINLYAYRYERAPETETHYTFKQFTPETEQQPQIVRSPSVLQRIKSFNLYNYISQEHGQLPQTDQIHYDFQQPQVEEEEEEEEGRSVENEEGGEEEGEKEAGGDEQAEEEDQQETLDEVFSRLNGVHVTRSMSDTSPAAGEIPVKLPMKMRKSASTKSAFSHFEEEDDAVVESLRPATVRKGKVGLMEADDEVDAKADDFINRFKHQLQLQRMNSIVKYEEMVGIGSSGKE